MFKAMKDAKRRAVEQVMYTVGASEKTTDLEYDDHVAIFHEMIGDMNECGAGLTSVLTHTKDMYTDANELAAALSRMYVRNNEVSLAGFQTTIEYKEMSISYRDIMTELNTIYRTSAAMVATEQALQPLYAAVTQLGPEVEEACKQREKAVLDYDSHRRRVKGLETKKEEMESKGKAGTAPFTDLLSEIARFQTKLQGSQDHFTELNTKTKADIVAAKLAHDKLLEGLIITTVVCQAELFAHTAKKLETICSQFPPAKVQQVRTRIHDYIKQGGVQVPKEEKTSMMKGISVLTGKSTIAELKEEDKQKEKDHFQHALDKEKAVMTIESEQKQKLPAAPLPPWSSSPPSAAVPVSSTTNKPASTVASPSSASAAPLLPATPPPSLPTMPPPTAPPSMISPSAPPSSNPFEDSNSPKAYHPPPPAVAPPPARPVVSAAPTLGRVIALYDHTVDEDDELEFNTGDVIDVLEKNDDGWWKGKCKGKVGLFPSNYVNPL